MCVRSPGKEDEAKLEAVSTKQRQDAPVLVGGHWHRLQGHSCQQALVHLVCSPAQCPLPKQLGVPSHTYDSADSKHPQDPHKQGMQLNDMIDAGGCICLQLIVTDQALK